jgi:hypothetical protein
VTIRNTRKGFHITMQDKPSISPRWQAFSLGNPEQFEETPSSAPTPPATIPHQTSMPSPTPNQHGSAALILPGASEEQVDANALTLANKFTSSSTPEEAGPAIHIAPFLHPTDTLPFNTRAKPRKISKTGWIIALTACLLICLVVFGSLLSRQASPTNHQAALSVHATASSPEQKGTATSVPALPIFTPTTTPTISPNTSSAKNCRVNYTVNTQWPEGFVATITITNLGATPVNNWTLTFTFPKNQRITKGWNGSFSQTGAQVNISNTAYNARILPASSTNPGFQAIWHSKNALPTSFTLNDSACTDSQ